MISIQTFRIKGRILLPLILLLITSTTLPSNVARAQQGSIDEVGMEVHLDFYKGAPRAIWTVYASQFVNGKQTIDEIRHIPLTCQNYGVSISGDVGTFLSKEHDFIKCLLPDFAAEIKKITKGEIIVGEYCACKSPWIAANVDLEYDPTSVGPLPDSNPLFYHNDMNYAVPYVDPANLVSLRSDYAGAPQPVSTPFYLNGASQWNAVWSGEDGVDFLDLADFRGWAAYLAAYSPSSIKDALHWANGQQIDQANGAAGNLRMNTGSTVIFFGVNPDTGAYFNGNVKQIDWDPGCRGIGG